MNERDVPHRDLSDRELALAVEESLFELFRQMARLPGAELEELGSFSRHLASPLSPMFKGVWATKLSPDDVHTAAEEVIAWFTERGAPYVCWWAGPTTEPSDLGARLEVHDFVPLELDAPGQVAELAALDWGALARVPKGFRVEHVSSERGLETFARVFVEAFGVPARAGIAWVDATRGFGLAEAPWDFYIGRLDEQPVATAMLFCGAGVARVLAVGTVQEARALGIGSAMPLAALADARERGYRYAVLSATELGAPVARRIGFRDVDAALSRWLWVADGSS